jgi:hypothetical protein
MARRGRPKMQGPRWECGKRIPASVPQSVIAKIVEAQQEQVRKAKEIVMAQPHRRLYAERPDDPWLATPFGRFCLAYRLRSELYEAGEKYWRLLYGWHLAKGLPVVGEPSGRGGAEPLDAEQSAKQIAETTRKIGSVELAMVARTHEGMLATKRLIWAYDGSGEDIPSVLHDSARDAIMGAAVHFCLIGRDEHPFRGKVEEKA